MKTPYPYRLIGEIKGDDPKLTYAVETELGVLSIFAKRPMTPERIQARAEIEVKYKREHPESMTGAPQELLF